MRAKRHSYQPPKRTNLQVLAKKIEQQDSRIQSLSRLVQSIVKSNNSHMDYIASFARHDLGNAIQNISAIIRLIENDLDSQIVESLKASVKHLDSTLANFGEIIHADPRQSFSIRKLMTAVEVFVRSSLAADNILIETDFDPHDETLINQSFQTLLQLIHNLIINSKKAINAVACSSETSQLGKKIVVKANIIDENCVIAVKDTGCGIPDENLEKIFEFGFTTTSGSGIGLYHALNVCAEIGGDISVSRNIDGFSTVFTLKFPIYGDQKDSCD